VTTSGYFDIGALQGALVRLEPLGASHVDALVEAAVKGRERYALTDVPVDRRAAEVYVQRAVDGRRTNSIVAFATIDQRTQRIVGSTRFCYFEYWRWQDEYRTRPKEIPDAVEIGGTWLALDAQRTGINREAKLLMLGVAFDKWQLRRVRLRTDARNMRSLNAIEGIGAHLDGVLRADAAGYDGAVRDSATYSITVADWPDVRTHLQATTRAVRLDLLTSDNPRRDPV
jgi:RimJ/RimL family protein N-acetyltransferase